MHDPETPAAVLDCVIYVQAMMSESGPSAEVLRAFEAGEFGLLASEEVLDEIKDVLSRPRIRTYAPHLTDERVQAFLTKLRTGATVLTSVPALVSLPRDPKDEKYLNLAIHARAGFIVTRDRHLLDLQDGDRMEDREFRALIPTWLS